MEQEDAKEIIAYLIDVSLSRRSNSSDKFSLYLFVKIFDTNKNKWENGCIRTIDTKTVTATLDATQKDLRNRFLGEIQSLKKTKDIQSLWVQQEDRRFMKEFCTDADIINGKSRIKIKFFRSDAPKFFSFFQSPGFKTIEHIFDSKFPPIDNFLIWQGLRGPCFLKVRDPNVPNLRGSYCPSEYIVGEDGVSMDAAKEESSDAIIPGFDFKIGNLTLILDRHNTIWLLGLQIIHTKFDDFYSSGATEKIETHYIVNDPHLQLQLPIDESLLNKRFFWRVNNETELIRKFVSFTHIDALIGYHLFERDLSLLFRKAFFDGVDVRPLGRLREIEAVKIDEHLKATSSDSYDPTILLPGVLLFDLKHCSKEFFPKSEVLSFPLWRQTYAKRAAPISSNNYDAIRFVDEVLSDQFQIFANEKWLSVTHQIAKKSGLPWKWVLMKPEMLRAEFLLNHSFHQAKFILPSRERSFRPGSARNEKVYGGLNLTPKSGLYSGTIILLDGKNLYPSCVVEHNLCLEQSTPVLPTVFDKLISEKAQLEDSIKKSESDPNRVSNLNTMRTAVKFILNKTYGCFASEVFLYSCKRLANEITEKGRHFLNTITTYLRENQTGCSVLFGVTDSVCILLPECADTEAKIREILDQLNSLFRCIRIKHEATFHKILVSTNKNEFAALKALPLGPPPSPGDLHCKGFSQAEPFDLKVPTILSQTQRAFLFRLLTAQDLNPSVMRKFMTESLEQFSKLASQKPALHQFAIHVHFQKNAQQNPALHALVKNLLTKNPNARVLSYLTCKVQGRTVNLNLQDAQSQSALPDIDYYKKQLEKLHQRVIEMVNGSSRFSTQNGVKKHKASPETTHAPLAIAVKPINCYAEIASFFEDSQDGEDVSHVFDYFICQQCKLKQIKNAQNVCINQLCKSH